VLGGKEFEHASVENTIESFKEAILCAKEYKLSMTDLVGDLNPSKNSFDGIINVWTVLFG